MRKPAAPSPSDVEVYIRRGGKPAPDAPAPSTTRARPRRSVVPRLGGPPKRRFVAYLPLDLAEQLERHAFDERTPLSDIFECAVREYLAGE